MLEQGGIWETQGLGTIFLAFVLLCYFVIARIKKSGKKSDDINLLPVESLETAEAAGSVNTAGIVAAITAAVNEYRKHNF